MSLSAKLRWCKACGLTIHKDDMPTIGSPMPVAVCPKCRIQGTIYAVDMPEGCLAVDDGEILAKRDKRGDVQFWAEGFTSDTPEGCLRVDEGERLYKPFIALNPCSEIPMDGFDMTPAGCLKVWDDELLSRA